MTRRASAASWTRRGFASTGLLFAALLAAAPAAAQFDLEEAGADLPYPNDRELLRRELTRPTSSIELGGHYVSEDSFKFGEFSGLDDKGLEFLGNLDLRRRGPWDGSDLTYWRLQGLNLGLDSRFLRGEYGRQGLFEVWLENDKIPHFKIEDALTPFEGRRGQTLTLPPTWMPAETADTMPSLPEALTEYDVQHEREALRGGFSLQLPERFEIAADWERETRDGTKLVGAVIGNNGGNPRTVLVPEPIDYRTNEVDATLRYGGGDLQAELGYHLSHFENLDESLTWENPYANLPGDWNPAVGFPAQGRKSTPPDNRFHQITASGGINLPGRTRVMVNGAYGWMKQDDSFLPYTVNPGLAVPTGLPSDDLDGEIQTTNVNVHVASRPIEKLRIDAGYRFDDRDNNTPVRIFQYVPGDSQDQEAIDEDTARRNRPYSFKKHEAEVEVGYEILPRTELALGYEHEAIDRTFTEREETRENFYRVKLHSRPWRGVSLRADFEHAERDGSDYVGNAPFLDGLSPQHIATPGFSLDDFENAPDLRKFYVADRDRDHLRVGVSWMPMNRLSIGLIGDYTDDDYKDSPLGLQELERTALTLDLSYALLENVRTHAFYTYEDYERDQLGRSWLGFLAVQAFDPTRNWHAEDEDTVDTIGAGVDVDLLEGRMSLGADYVYSRTKGDVAVSTRSGLPAASGLPDVDMRLHDVSLHADYRLRPDVRLRLGYLFEMLDEDDFGIQGIFPVVPGNEETIFAGEKVADYKAHVFSVSVAYEFQ